MNPWDLKAFFCALAAFFGLAFPTICTPPPPTPPPPPSPVVTSPVGQSATMNNSDLGLFEDLQYLSGAVLDARLDEFDKLGITAARFQVVWANIQRGGPTSFDWAPTDELVNKLVARGIHPLATISTTPAWAARAPRCSVDVCGPTDPAQTAAFAQAAAQRYVGKVNAWEFWNEPNLQVFWAPGPNADLYARNLAAVYPAIKRGNPQATVISGGLSPAATIGTSGPTASSIDPVSFIDTVYRVAGAKSLDAVGWHPYCYPALPGGGAGQDAWSQMAWTALSVRQIMVDNGDSAKKIWATEFGAHTDPLGIGYLDEFQQANYIGAGIDAWRGYDWAGPMFVYQLRDRGMNLLDREDWFGLQRFDGSNKPAYDVVASRARAR